MCLQEMGIILRQVGAFDIARQQVTCHAMEFARGGLLESVKDSLGTKGLFDLACKSWANFAIHPIL